MVTSKPLKHIDIHFQIAFRLTCTGHYWQLLKITVRIKTYLVRSNGELLIV